MKNLFKAALLAAILFAVGVGTPAQQASATSSIALQYASQEFVQISVSGTGIMTFTQNGQTSATAPPATVTLTVQAASTRTKIGLVYYFQSGNNLIGNNTSFSIPYGDVWAADSGSTSGVQGAQMTAAPCNKSLGTVYGVTTFAGGGCFAPFWNLTSANDSSTFVDTLTLSLQGLPTNLPVDQYSGILSIYAGLV